jgi:potassium-transporting ATPase KdpC subunit
MLTSLVRPALVMTLALCVLTGVVYPGVVTAIAQLLFPVQANGSLITRDGDVRGSALIGQGFAAPQYFHSRPSAAGANGYDASASAGSNRGPTDSTLLALVTDRVGAAVANGATAGQVPTDLVTASGSGLDPHISPANAALQIARVANARGVPPSAVQTLVQTHTEARQFGVLGEPRVNVLQLNLAVDSAFALRGGAVK